MYSRLAFSVLSTIIGQEQEPSLLIIDEVLGAGDAYFGAKCTNKMKELTNNGSAVLFVSHDMSSVQMLCDRAVWLEKGVFIMDSDPIEVGKAYAASIRKQENLRLKAMNLSIQRSQLKEVTEQEAVLFRLITCDSKPPKAENAIYSIALYSDEELLSKLELGSPQDNSKENDIYILTSTGFTNWSKPISSAHNAQPYREYKDIGGRYIHAPFIGKLHGDLSLYKNLKIVICHHCLDIGIRLEIMYQERYVLISSLKKLEKQDAQVTEEFSLSDVIEQIEEESNEKIMPETEVKEAQEDKQYIYGSQEAVIHSVELYDENNKQNMVFIANRKLSIHLHWECQIKQIDILFVISFYGLDGKVISQVISQPIHITDQQQPKNATIVSFEPLQLGKGEYIISIGIYKAFSLSERYASHPLFVIDRQYRIKVQQEESVNVELGQLIQFPTWKTTCLIDAAGEE